MNTDVVEKALKKISLPHSKGPIAIGLSGGVDSAVTAALLKQLGYDVFGIFMKNWETTDDSSCQASQDASDVAAIAHAIKIPFYPVSFAKEYWESVFALFLEDLKKGLTPNPDILCNREIKFSRLLEKALTIGATALATGHYAQIISDDTGFHLHKALDHTKDQSYFLYTASQYSLSHSLFPLGKITKKEVRAIALTLKIPVATKKDSTGICFIGEKNFRQFLSSFLGYSPGPILTVTGKQIGTHVGLAYYTIGQRKGLGIGGAGDAWFVIRKNLSENTLIVAQGSNHPDLFAKSLIAHEASWISGKEPSFPQSVTAKIRYRQEDQQCSIFKIEEPHEQFAKQKTTSDKTNISIETNSISTDLDEKLSSQTVLLPQLKNIPNLTKKFEKNKLLVHFEHPQRAITPEQSIVFYRESECLGGAFITSPYDCNDVSKSKN